MTPSKKGRLIIVSNRLPFTIDESNGAVEFAPSNGGLATGLSSLELSDDVKWVGWPGALSRTDQAQVAERLEIVHQCHPVFLSERLIEKYYDGFSNKTLWPLFHSFQSYAKYSSTEWQGYEEANERFLQVLDGLIQPGDRVWVHDYQLMLLPGLLRQRFPNLTIGFFLHIPFPPFDVLRLLPQYRTLLQSLLAADLVGFHTNDYARSFLNGVHRTFGLDDRLGQILVGNRVVQTIVHPMGIDFDRFSSTSIQLEGDTVHRELKTLFTDMKIVFSVSRLDYTKGIPQSLSAFERVLDQRPDLHRKTAYVLCVVPSRERLDKYDQLKREIDEAVGRINSKYGSVEWTPIRYLYRTLSFEELVSLYKSSHVALVTPLRDGLNLVAKEFIASRSDERGVLVLSEFAGASKELLEAIIVNPNGKDEMRNALETALDMNPIEQGTRMRALRDRLLENPIDCWSEEFVEKMERGARLTSEQMKKALDPESVREVVGEAYDAKSKLVVLDYDGTLMPLVAHPKFAEPDDRLRELLSAIVRSEKTDLVIVSGRSKNDLERWLGSYPITLIAEHGAWIRKAGQKKWTNRCANVSTGWKERVGATLEDFVENVPGSWLEQKDYSLVWHYRRSEPESADLAAKDLAFHILSLVGELPVRVVPGNKSIEIRSMHTGKGSCLNAEFDLSSYDFVFCAGDDVTDEDLFSVLPTSAISVKVGPGFSRATYRAKDHLELRRTLLQMFENSGAGFKESKIQ